MTTCLKKHIRIIYNGIASAKAEQMENNSSKSSFNPCNGKYHTSSKAPKHFNSILAVENSTPATILAVINQR